MKKYKTDGMTYILTKLYALVYPYRQSVEEAPSERAPNRTQAFELKVGAAARCRTRARGAARRCWRGARRISGDRRLACPRAHAAPSNARTAATARNTPGTPVRVLVYEYMYWQLLVVRVLAGRW